MAAINVLAAAAASFAFGAVWYMILAEPWMRAAAIRRDAAGKPEGGQNPIVFALTFVMQLLVAGMMRHVFALGGIDTLGEGLLAGAGIGLFFIVPWMVINNSYGMRPPLLSVIDGGYAVIGTTLMGLVLVLF